ncbi:MAG: class I SAM-dependent methyltransferase [Lachnospiraceae bacterium]|nr:class I SAM-dependent methyltransferase [Lachnospiraceae bacterium]
MAVYDGFASAYDALMRDVPYEKWVDLCDSMIRRHGVSRPVYASAGTRTAIEEERDLVVDLGCGTGTFTGLLADRGYDVTGVDISPEMLAVAQEKNETRKQTIPYLCQDMRTLDLYCTAGTFVSVCDSVNYLLTDRDVIRTFAGINRFLFPGGIFLFDFNTVHKYRDVIGSETISESGEDAAFIWENRFRARGNRNEAALTLFVGQPDGRYCRFEETHVQRGFTLTEIRGFLRAAGLRFVTALDERTGKKPYAKSERILVVARESGKRF